jgi:C1A family cysteine protease
MKKIITFGLIFVVISMLTSNVFAKSIADYTEKNEYSQRYLDWLELSEEEKANTIQPRMYNVYRYNRTYTNPLKLARVKSTTYDTKFDLNSYIKENLVIKNQGNLGAYWAFASLGSLETNLALKNYYANKKTVLYDFSEKHLNYSMSKSFIDSTSELGFQRNVEDGGIYLYAQAYLTNGMGAVNESDMSYDDNSESIYISDIQDKTVQTEVYDTIEFPSTETTDVENLKNMMKDFIKNYGGIDANIYEPESEEETFLNTSTGALYCDDSTKYANHDILIVGWNDEYEITNFNENYQPSSKGAWIVKDSHGDNEDNTYSIQEIKEELYKYNETYFNQNGINEASDIPDSVIEAWAEEYGYQIENGYIFIKHNDNGYLYVSYEDVIIYTMLWGVQSANDSVSYDNIYQYNNYGYIATVKINCDKVYIANVFEKETSGDEYISKVALNVVETTECAVYINPNGDSLNNNDLTQVTLTTGETATLEAGYHVLELDSPIKINGSSFAIMIEMISENNSTNIPVETSYSGVLNVDIEKNRCFYTVESYLKNNVWFDFGTADSDTNGAWYDSNTTIKAFTISEVENISLTSIKITTPPKKTEYKEGDNFDSTGMVITATYSDGTSKQITDYNITNGTNLKLNQTSVTITYMDKSVQQSISVKENTTNTGNNDENENTANNGNTENIEKEEVQPINSNFDNATVNITKIDLYTYTDEEEQEYATMTFKIDNIDISTVNDSLEYYYYISGSMSETNIENWIKINESYFTNGTLTFTINTRDIENFEEISNAENLYIYVKEIAIKGGNKKVYITDPMIIEYDSDDISLNMYIDDNYIGNLIDGMAELVDQKEDESTIDKPIPQTGETLIIIVAIIGMSGIILYNIKKIRKFDF